MSAPIYTALSPIGGTGLFLSNPIPAGASILTLPSPLITIPSDALLPQTCSACLSWKPPSPQGMATYYTSPSALLTCIGCRTVKYCDKTCQRSDWKQVHKKECPIFSRLHPRTLPASIRATLRLILLGPPPSATANSIQSHVPDFARTSRFPEICLMAKGAHAYSSTSLPESAVLEMYCKVLTNTLTLSTPLLDPVGLAFDPLLAKANHSCRPNAAAVWTGKRLTLRALQAVRAGEEVTVAYVDTTFPRETRRRELRERWFFDCSCPLCSQGGSAAATDMLSCPGGCGGGVKADEDPLVCVTCGKETGFTVSRLRGLEEGGGEEIGPTEKLRVLCRTRMYPPHRQPLPSLHAAVLHECLGKREWKEAARHALLLHTLVNPKLYAQTHPVRVRDAFLLAALLIEVSADPDPEFGGVDWAGVVMALLKECERGCGDEWGLRDVVRAKITEVEEATQGRGVRDLKAEMKKAERVVEGLINELRGQ